MQTTTTIQPCNEIHVWIFPKLFPFRFDPARFPPYSKLIVDIYHLLLLTDLSIMVAITVITKGKPTLNLDFAGKHPDKVTIADLKSAITAKFPKVSQLQLSASHFPPNTPTFPAAC